MATTAPLNLGRYVLHHELAAGGMATVHLATLTGQAGFRRLVAIKRMHPHLSRNPEFVEMFTDEARLASRLRHPHVVPVIDVVDSNGELLLVMEYVVGVSLAVLLDGARECQQPLPWPVSARIACDALEGLHAAHEARSDEGESLGIVHRDFSPHNLLVGSDGTTRVLDFGIAKATRKLHQTSTGVVRGKAAYMAPEQLEGQEVDARADVYAAGITLWEMLVGRRAFSRGSDAEIAAQVLRATVPEAHLANPDVPVALSQIVSQALARDPQARFPSARAFAEAIEAATPVAPPRVVAQFLRNVAADALHKTERQSRDLTESSSHALASTVDEKPEARERGVRPLWLLLAAGALGLGFLWGRDRSAPPAVASARPVPAAPQPTAARAAPTPAPLPLAPPAATTTTAPEPKPQPATLKKPKTKAPTTPTPPVDDLFGQH